MTDRSISLAVCLLAVTAARAEDWPEFRGPTGQGHYTGKPLPMEWSPTKNIAWKQPIPGKGWSSPVVQAGRVYLTTAVPVDGKDQSLRALCLDAGTGKIVWEKEIFRQDGAKAPRIHNKNSHASPTPLVDGQRLYVHFGHQGTAALDLAGNVVWRNTELRYAPVHGNGGSLIRVGEHLVFSIDGSDQQYLAALDRTTGEVAWKGPRKSEAGRRFSFSTPLVIEAGGKRQIISPASDVVIAYDADNKGSELWRVKYQGYSVIPRPVHGHGLVFLSTGYDRPTLLAIRPGGKAEPKVVWSTAKGAPHTPSPLLVGDELYLVSDQGIASCLDARTGKVHWSERVDGQYSASPLHAAGKVYLQSEDGTTTVLRAGTTFDRLAVNKLDEKTLASYAVADGAIYLRTEGHLYRIEAR